MTERLSNNNTLQNDQQSKASEHSHHLTQLCACGAGWVREWGERLRFTLSNFQARDPVYPLIHSSANWKRAPFDHDHPLIHSSANWKHAPVDHVHPDSLIC